MRPRYARARGCHRSVIGLAPVILVTQTDITVEFHLGDGSGQFPLVRARLLGGNNFFNISLSIINDFRFCRPFDHGGRCRRRVFFQAADFCFQLRVLLLQHFHRLLEFVDSRSVRC